MIALEDLVKDITVKLNKYGVKLWCGLFWLRTQVSFGIL
jgi:hypothetical protein